MSDIEYSVITSDVIKSFDCTLIVFALKNIGILDYRKMQLRPKMF